MEFWEAIPPKGSSRAEVGESVDFESVVCPISPPHRRAGKRIGDLEVVLPDGAGDFVWTWYSDLLVQESALEALSEAGITGYVTRPVTTRYRRKAKVPPRMWELVITGWGGVARPESGIHLDTEQSCGTCGHLLYSGLRHPEKLVDETQWDGSDIFMVWPLPRYPLATPRVMEVVRKYEMKGLNFQRVFEMAPTEGFAPGRLSYWMPESRARLLGTPLGIV